MPATCSCNPTCYGAVHCCTLTGHIEHQQCSCIAPPTASTRTCKFQAAHHIQRTAMHSQEPPVSQCSKCRSNLPHPMAGSWCRTGRPTATGSSAAVDLNVHKNQQRIGNHLTKNPHQSLDGMSAHACMHESNTQGCCVTTAHGNARVVHSTMVALLL